MYITYDALIKRFCEFVTAKNEDMRYLAGPAGQLNIIGRPKAANIHKNLETFLSIYFFNSCIIINLLKTVKTECIRQPTVRELPFSDHGIHLVLHALLVGSLQSPVKFTLSGRTWLYGRDCIDGNVFNIELSCKDIVVKLHKYCLIRKKNPTFRRVEKYEIGLTASLKKFLASTEPLDKGAAGLLHWADRPQGEVYRKKIHRNVKFCEKLCLLNRKKCLNFEANLTSCRSNTPRVFNPVIFKIVTLLAKSQREMQGDLKFEVIYLHLRVSKTLQSSKESQKFPLFTAVDRICRYELKPADMVGMIRNHPEH
ncbi:unnamed protein product, partial [Meganyctiphanes norvegica]